MKIIYSDNEKDKVAKLLMALGEDEALAKLEAKLTKKGKELPDKTKIEKELKDKYKDKK